MRANTNEGVTCGVNSRRLGRTKVPCFFTVRWGRNSPALQAQLNVTHSLTRDVEENMLRGFQKRCGGVSSLYYMVVNTRTCCEVFRRDVEE